MKNKNQVTGKKSMVTKAQLRQAIRGFEVKSRELKYTNPITTGSYSAAGIMYSITQTVTQGDSAQQRDGNSINLKSIEFVWQSQLNTSANFDWARLVIFIDTQNTGADPAVSQLLMSAVSGAPHERFVFITKRYRVLFDEVVTLTNSGSNKITHIKHKLKLKDHHVEYLGTTNAQASNGPGAVYALLLADASVNFSAYSLNVALKYYDA